MASLSRPRGFALAGITSLALVMPVAPPATAAPAAAVSAPAATTVQSVPAASVGTSGAAVTGWKKWRRRQIIRTARALRGIPYVWGGTTPRGFDCSGYTQYVYRVNGYWIPRNTNWQRAATRWVSHWNRRKGDLVFFHRGGNVYHVGIYAGRNKIWHSPRPGRWVRKEWIWSWNISYGRVI